MNFFNKQLLHHSLCCIFVDIRSNAFVLSGSILRTISTLCPEFWIFISKMKNGVGQLCCPVLSKFCLDWLALPHSSAAVERIFSCLVL